eukprot:TRINITY_DN1824_c2_g2_i2.p2 TRINITY_DN1824_c2_g2~~TRINITY_DN1824_c2_g2_i2.p2  ORF type:complete len:197 (-),score=30.09 TRINITY_DN1824_c2_g2_i2:389-979(-)
MLQSPPAALNCRSCRPYCNRRCHNMWLLGSATAAAQRNSEPISRLRCPPHTERSSATLARGPHRCIRSRTAWSRNSGDAGAHGAAMLNASPPRTFRPLCAPQVMQVCCTVRNAGAATTATAAAAVVHRQRHRPSAVVRSSSAMRTAREMGIEMRAEGDRCWCRHRRRHYNAPLTVRQHGDDAGGVFVETCSAQPSQ